MIEYMNICSYIFYNLFQHMSTAFYSVVGENQIGECHMLIMV